MDTLKIREGFVRKTAFLMLLASITSFIIAEGGQLLLVICTGIALFMLLVRKPELSLAILFNGSIIYFYLIYKLDIGSSRLLSGGFYAFLALSYLLGGFFLNSGRLHKLRLSSVDVLFVFFFIWVFFNYFIFYSGSESAYTKIMYAPLLVITPYVGIRLLSSMERIDKFINYCVLLAAMLIIPSLYELLFNPLLAKASGFSIYLIRGEEANHILFGLTFAILLLIIFIKLFERKAFDFRHIILIIPSAYLLLRSASRGALISLVITMLFYLLFITTMRFKLKIYAVFFILLLILGAYKLMPEPTIVSYSSTFEYQDMPEKLSSVLQRITMWKEAINDFKENPVFGVGMGNSIDGSGFPHNIILEVSAELGILGIFMFLSMCYLTVKKALRFIKNEKRKDINLLMKLSLLLFIYSFVEAMFSGYITNQTYFFMSMGLIVSLTRCRHSAYASKGRSRVTHERTRAL